MAELLKEYFYSEKSMDGMIRAIAKNYAKLDIKEFKNLIYDEQWKNRELKQKMYHVSECLHAVLPDSYNESINILIKAAPQISGWESMSLPDYVEKYGMKFWDISMKALKEFTKYGSSEFAIRPFIIQDTEKTMNFLLGLADDKNEHVRRFSSEGCRPRLPWAMALPAFKKDPSPILPILEKLKDDESEYVRKSVANNLNDISKDNPEIVLKIAKRWSGQSSKTDWIVKHACRTLLKAGNKQALELFGFGNSENIQISGMNLDKKSISLGETISFSFELEITGDKEINVRLEYGVYYVKSNGEQRRKVFQISEKVYSPGPHKIVKRQKIVDMTTRKHYQGTHAVSLIVNGDEKEKNDFMLMI